MSSLVKFLRTYRPRGDVDETVEVCEQACSSSRALAGGDEQQWVAREQLVKSYLDRGDVGAAQRTVKELRAKFGDESQRVALLHGLVLEAEEKWDAVQALYTKMLKENRGNVLVAKRTAAFRRAQGDVEGCIAALNALVADNHSDVETWAELMEVNMLLGHFDAALFCAEEVLLANTHSYLSHCLYGEILLTSARGAAPQKAVSRKRLEESRAYFSQSLVLKSGGNARAAWGLLLCTVKEEDGGAEAEDATTANLAVRLNKKACDVLRSEYTSSPLKAIFERVIIRLERIA